MAILSDPISGVLSAFFNRALESKIGQRVTLLLEMGVAGIIAFLASCGIALLSNQPIAWSVGCGMVATAVALLATFQASPNSKGLIISLPQQAASKEIDTPMTTIERK